MFCSLTKSQKSGLFTGSLCVVLFGVLDNVGFGGGRNGFISIQSIGKQDTAIAVMFLVTSILLIYSIINDSFKEEEKFLFNFFTIHISIKSKWYKHSFYFLLIYFLIFKKIKQKYFLYFKRNKLFILYFFLWLFKSILHTGCWIFPLESSCYSRLSWVDSKYIQNIENVTVNFSNSYYFGDSFQLWVNKYLELPLNSIVFRNFALSAFVIFALLVLFLKKIAKK